MVQTLTDPTQTDDTTLQPQTPKPQVVKPPVAPTAPTPGPTGPTQTPSLPVAPTPQGGGPTLPVAPAQTTDPMAFTAPPPTLSTQNAPTFAPVNTQAPVGDAPPGPSTTPTPPTAPVTTPTAPPQYTGPAYQPQNTAGLFTPQDPGPLHWSDGMMVDASGHQPTNMSAADQAYHNANAPVRTEADKLLLAAAGGEQTTVNGLNPGDPGYDAARQKYLTDNAAKIATLKQQEAAYQTGQRTSESTAAQTFDNNNQHALDAQLATGLNSQPGYAGSGLAYADPNDPGHTIANPLSQSQSPQGGPPVTTTTQTGPTSQGGVVLPQNGLPGTSPISNTGPGINLGGDTKPVTPNPSNTLGPSLGPSMQNGLPANGPSTTPTLTPLTPDNALTNSIISPSSNVNRFDVAKNQIHDEIQNELEPQFNSDARTIAAQSFGSGRGVSGNNRTKEGDLALQHSRDINQLTSNYLNPALTGTIQDSLNNANFEADQQKFEAGQQNTAFNQAVTGQTLADQEQGQSFYQALQKLLAGSSGDPAQIQLLLSELYGGQSAQDSAAAGKLAQSAVG